MVVAKGVDWRSRQNWRILYKAAVCGTVFLMAASLLNRLYPLKPERGPVLPGGKRDKSFVLSR
ncbi:MAG: hypothetical protein QOJ42_4800 [Acidobacteriaceae bacterium]|nr:hypothetical protein [Acidobacteriaceae bacterium]